MKGPLLVLLVLVLCAELAQSLRCYSCGTLGKFSVPNHCPTSECDSNSTVCYTGNLSMIVEAGVLGTAASASLAASPPLCSTGKVSGHLWASPTPARAAGSCATPPPPSRGTRLNRGGGRCAGERGRRAGPGRQAAPLALEHRLSGRDCGLRRAPAPRQFGLRLQAGDLRPLTGQQL
ncbi:hypothetical protein R6Z07F_009417 [Ovis aries]